MTIIYLALVCVSIFMVLKSPEITPFVSLGDAESARNDVIAEMLRQHRTLFWIFSFLLIITSAAFAVALFEFIATEKINKITTIGGLVEGGLLFYTGQKWNRSFDNLKAVMK